ncbi:hypothetical protein LOZ39_004530 [Ophidiomyces ophidiicola]|uniref:Uncharacterized protein n=1 Tax=Ophidiomyces ophidiicola TaxID=1387563 RepID=A0ACB8UQN4_9EURO|nr:hypothetical protein LOZ61_005171 [Ophidiomyces ophidiicola]KAI1911400.1 hypothetical protein LOZ64_004729 [Ophidiomyces ophidiicola]KAI1930954.1 hypothetical protein LOZ60_000614 [Ophidiomyces ophidiicola]KAI1954413.1 hypothetical protein LOZ59_004937 [Ophidiomyces ophidiicola]KAI1967956.1 hypothetical protein LOZ56_005283 [Ophidiomyces ophidiicola]
MRFSSIVAGTAIVGGSLVSALDRLEIKGTKFFYKNGTEFFMKGIAYQQEYAAAGTGSTNKDGSYKDPLADVTACKRDIPLMQELRTNTIRVYAIDPTKDHKECMKMLDDAGIYVVADLGEPKTSINRDSPTWDEALYTRYTGVIDELAKYPNVIGFFSGNEVTNNRSNTVASAFVKAATRDMKAYIKSKGYANLGVGYATNDDAEIRDDMTDYFNCNSRDESIDFWGYNIYSWCGDSSFTKAGYDKVVRDFQNFSVPVFFAEYGCNEVQPRKFTEVGAIYGSQMTDVLSGGIVYMYFQEANNYGLVEVQNGQAKKKDDFKYLADQMKKIDPKRATKDSYQPSNGGLRTCPNTQVWKLSKTLPPTPNKELCGCMTKSLACVANDNISDKDIAKLFGTVCGLSKTACAGIATDAIKGAYGAYSMCNPKEQLSFAMNAYFQEQSGKGNGQNACDFGGNARKQSPVSPSGNCDSLIKQAGKDGTGSVTSSPNASGSKSAASPMTIPSFNFNILNIGAYLFCAIIAGAGTVLL